jgi:PAS domain S-box-containing protein
MEAVAKEKRRVAYTLVLSFAILALGMVVGGIFYYRNYEQHFRAEAEHQLSAIAELKVGELAEYRKERLGDAAVFFNNAAFSGLVRRFFEHPEDAEAQQQVQEWAVKYMATDQYDLVRLIDPQGVIRMSVPAGQPPLSSVVAQRISEVLRSGQVTLQDFHRNEHDQQVYLTLLVPILDRPDHSQALGVLALRINPETYLYPFIKRWPMPSRTAETLLVRLDGNVAVFLNELKFQTNTALTLRIPLDKTDRPAVKAVLGQKGIVEGRDYRGVPVIAYVCAVPDSPWFMVARMDIAEVYAPLRERLWMIILLVGALVLCAGLGAGAIWRHQRVQFYKEQYKMAEALRESEERFGRVFEEGPIGMVMLDETFHFIQVNPAFTSMLGYSEKEMRTMAFTDITHPDYVQGNVEQMRCLLRGELSVYSTEKRYIAKSGKELWGLVQVSVVRNAAGAFRYFLAIISDITERKRTEAVRRENEERLRSHTDNSPMAVVEWNADLIITRWTGAAEKMFGWSAEEAIGKPITELPGICEEDLPIVQSVIQQLADGVSKHVFSSNRNRTRNGRVIHCEWYNSVLHDAGGKMTSVLSQILDITERKRAEEALHHEQTLMATLMKNLPDAIYFKDTASRFLRVNPATARKSGLSTPEQMIGKSDKDFFTGEHASKALADEQEIIRTGQPLVNIEEKETWPDGSETWVLTTKLPLRDAAGRIIGTCGISSDITASKRADEALANERVLLRTLVDNLPVAFYMKDLAGRKTLVNRVELDYVGAASEAEVLGKTDFDIYPPERAAVYRAYDQEVIRSGQPIINREGDLTKLDGSVIHTIGSVVPIRDAAGRVTGLAGITFDITDRKRAEERLLKVITQTRCILYSGHVTAPEGWRKRALEPNSPFHWDTPVLNEQTAQKIVPLELAAGEQYLQAWERNWNRADAAQMNWNSGNAFLNDLPFYRNEFRCIDKHGVGHWIQEFVTIQKLAENRWQIFSIATDISDLKRVETELRESQALYDSLVDQMPAGVFRKNSKGRFLFVNSAFCRLKEMTPDQFLGKTPLELGWMDVALATKGAGHHATIMQSGNRIEDEEVYSRADGETRNYHVVKSPVIDSAGKIVGTQGILFDITERKRAEQDLEQAFQRQRGISWLNENLLASRPLRDKLQLVTETIVRLFDADFCRIWLTRSGDLCEQGCMHALVTEGPHVCQHREICLHLLASAGRYTHLDGARHRRVPYGAYKIGSIAAGKEAKFLINNVQQDPRVHDREWAKELGLVSFAGYRLQSPRGAPLGVLALFAKRPLTAQEDVLLEALSNVTTSVLLTHLAEDESRRELAERKRAEEALRWSETQLQVILESTADGLLAVDSKGKVIETNQRFAELWRIPQSLMDAGDDRALLDFVLKQLSDPDAFLKKEQSLYGTDAMDMDTLAFKDGRIFERYYFPMMMDGAVIGRVWSFRDITGRKRQEKELSEKNSELERFTYTVSHDLKSPLVTVKTFLGYLEQDLARPDKERIKQDVAYMHTAADKMGQLLDELLNLARVGRKSNPAERVTFKELAQEAIRLVAGRISTGGAEVQVADAAVVLEGDRPRLMEIWQNLVENACKFMGNQPKPRVEIGVEKRGSETVFFVRDNGMGIDPRYQAKVFGLFEKLDPKGEGTGMGLTLVKRIVEMHKGRIWVESPWLGQGANFLFTLPGAVIIDPEQSS